MMENIVNRFEIKAFRKISNVTLNDLSRINLFVGENNSGKTSILEAIRYYCSPMDPSELIAIAHRSPFSELETITALRWVFPKERHTPEGEFLESKIEVTGYTSSVKRNVSCDLQKSVMLPSEISIRGSNGEAIKLPIVESSLRRNVALLKLNYIDQEPDSENVLGFATQAITLKDGEDEYVVEENVHKGKTPCAFLTPIDHRIDGLQRSQFSKATVEFLKKDVLEALKLIDDDIQGIDIVQPGVYSNIQLEVFGLGYEPLVSFGDGIRRVLSYSISLAQAQSGILIIDEIETAIHKDAITKAFRWLVAAARKLDVQIFATTHSLEAIDALIEAMDGDYSDIVAFRLPRKNSKEVLARYSGESLHDLRFRGGLEIR